MRFVAVAVAVTVATATATFSPNYDILNDDEDDDDDFNLDDDDLDDFKRFFFGDAEEESLFDAEMRQEEEEEEGVPKSWQLKLHPSDDGEGLNPVYFTNPYDFHPEANPEFGVVEAWGTFGPSPDNARSRWPTNEKDARAEQKRMLQSQMWYHPMVGGRQKSPEAQWTGVRISEKRVAIAATRELSDIADMLPADVASHLAPNGRSLEFKLRVAIVKMPELAQIGGFIELSPSIWRRLLVHGRTSLRALHDSVLGPALGWRRAYHCYLFSDITDGAMLGPPDCGGNDYMHVAYRAGCRDGCVMDDAKIELGDVVHKPGDRLLYTYDLGDGWTHVITVESARPANRSTADKPAVVLDGAMACPPEDSVGINGMGAEKYEKQVLQHPKIKAGLSLPGEMRNSISGSANYAQAEGLFDPLAFSLRSAQRRVEQAATSKPTLPRQYSAGNPYGAAGRGGTYFAGARHGGDLGGHKHDFLKEEV